MSACVRACGLAVTLHWVLLHHGLSGDWQKFICFFERNWHVHATCQLIQCTGTDCITVRQSPSPKSFLNTYFVSFRLQLLLIWFGLEKGQQTKSLRKWKIKLLPTSPNCIACSGLHGSMPVMLRTRPPQRISWGTGIGCELAKLLVNIIVAFGSSKSWQKSLVMKFILMKQKRILLWIPFKSL